MYYKNIIAILLLCISCFSHAQNVYVGEYRTNENPNYWKNKMPDKAYWQQDVHYNIDAIVDEEKDIISASESLVYWNNSPDTLSFVYFHLYQNAFVKGSYLSDLYRENKQKINYSKNAENGLGTTTQDILVNGISVKTELDNTILKIYLPEKLVPGKSVVFSMKFKTYFGNGTIRRRMATYNAWGQKHFNGVHWYPRICVYDRRKGWDLDQHLNKELYGDYGTFEVNLNFASNFIVEATGELKNESEVLPDDLKNKIWISNFKEKPWNEKPSIIIPYNKSDRKTWKFKAVNVHDFAFTADPSYRISYSFLNGVKCVAIAQEPHAAKWQNASEYVSKIIKTFSEDFGDYVYPKIVAADANDGMEYPMITLDGGEDPGYRGLFVHEIGHNWFYGMVGNNETYRATLDEGFTQFLTEWGLKKIDGKVMVESPSKNKYIQKYKDPVDVRFRNVYYRYLIDNLIGDLPDNNKHSNDYHGALGHENGYGEVYYKGAIMLDNLQYVLGDSLFSVAMKHYVSSWKIAHPYISDFRTAIHDATKLDLDWFFDQWFETTKNINYKIVNAKIINDSLHLKLKRNADMIMPIDLAIINKNNDTSFLQIPNTYFHKNEIKNVLPRWFAFEGTNNIYKTKLPFKNNIKAVIIDPSNSLADIYKLNNSKYFKLLPKEKFDLKFDSHLSNLPNMNKYQFFWRPDIWWNSIDGLKPGIHFNGNYMNLIHNFNFTLWYNTKILNNKLHSSGMPNQKLNYTFNYSTVIPKLPKISLFAHAQNLEGFIQYFGGVKYKTKNLWNISTRVEMNYRNDLNYLNNYLILNDWESGNYSNLKTRNLFLETNVFRPFNHFIGNSDLNFTLRNSIAVSNKINTYNYSYANVEYKRYFNISKLEWKIRAFSQIGTTLNFTPIESALNLSGGNNESAMNNKYTRSEGILTTEKNQYNPYDINKIQYGGGLNLRGLNQNMTGGSPIGFVYNSYAVGNAGASLNTEIDFDNYIKFKPKWTKNWLKMDAYIFNDIAVINNKLIINKNVWSPIFIDAGLGFAMTIKKFAYLSNIKPLTFRIDFPIFVNNPTIKNPDYLLLRYVIGINRSF